MKDEKLQLIFNKIYEEKPLTEKEIMEIYHLSSHYQMEKRIKLLEMKFNALMKRPPKIKILKNKVIREVDEEVPPKEKMERVE